MPEKVQRPVPMERVEEAINSVKRKVRETGVREIDSRTLGEFVMEALRGLDQVAYVRFASVYRSFEDVRAFLEEIEMLENDLPPDIRDQQLDLLPSEDKKESK